MDRIELNNKLHHIRDKSNKDNAAQMLTYLDEIFNFKPVTILYFNVRAKVLCDIGKYDEAIELLKFKLNLCFPEEEYLETCKILQNAYKAIGSETYYKQWYCLELYINYMHTQNENLLSKIKELEQEIVNMEDLFLNNPRESEVENQLAKAYWESWYTLESTVMYATAIKKLNINYKKSMFFKERIELKTNYAFLLDQLIYSNNAFTLVCTEENYTRIMVLAKAIKLLGHDVFVIMPPVLAEVDKNIDINETVGVSMENIEVDEEGIIKIRPIDISYNNKVIDTNTHLVLEEIVKKQKNDFSMLIASGESFSSINKIQSVKKRMQRLSDFEGDFFERNLIFGYFGSYLSYVSNIYSLDVKSEIEQPSECQFSIVIPVRNSAESLKYTLKTCLEQRGIDKTDYEIIVSDNSLPEYKDVENVVKEFNDPRIRYFRTPRELPLGKSFEYAFIKARGEFIFSIGADDGVLPWGLETIRESLKGFPDDDVFQWDRGFFIWPDNDKVYGQAGQFIIPRGYRSTDEKVGKYKSLEKLFSIMDNPSLMYGLPMLYINSGFRRRYLNKLLQYTGRLWDGGSQDVYMGIVNLTINDNIPYINAPITIAGMTSSSIGIEGNNGFSMNEEYVNRMHNYYSNYGNIVPYDNGLKSICVSLDTSLLYSSFFRVLNIYESEKLNLIADNIDLKKVFEIIATKLAYDNLRFDYDIKSLRYSAYYNNYELGEWFDNNVLNVVTSPVIISYSTEKSYSEGFNENGGLHLDCRKFNVNDIYGATKFFQNICNL